MIEIRNILGEVIYTSNKAKNLEDAIVECVKNTKKLNVAKLSGANLQKREIPYAEIIFSDMDGANLCCANLRHSSLCGTHFRNADLSGANLSGANLSYTDLSGANLCGADLSGADLRLAKLNGANLNDANLCGTLIGGYEMFRKLTDIPNYLTNGIAYFVYDDEQGMFEFFNDKESIIDYFGIENISENYMLDNN